MSYRTWTATFHVDEEPDGGATFSETLLDGVAELGGRLIADGLAVSVTMTDTHGANVLGPIR